MTSDSVPVNCSFCNKEITCPPDMLQAKYHACFECYEEREELDDLDEDQLHVDIPTDNLAGMLTSALMEEDFPQIWATAKDDIREMSKREIAENMFAAGVAAALRRMGETMEGFEDEVDEKYTEDGSSTAG